VVRVGRVQRHSPRAKPAVVVVAAAIAVVAAAAVGGWRTRVGGSAEACPAEARSVSNRQQETRAHAHGKELRGVDVKVIEDGQTVGVLELMSHWEGWPRGGQ
jgi:hypothetical protein